MWLMLATSPPQPRAGDRVPRLPEYRGVMKGCGDHSDRSQAPRAARLTPARVMPIHRERAVMCAASWAAWVGPRHVSTHLCWNTGVQPSVLRPAEPAGRKHRFQRSFLNAASPPTHLSSLCEVLALLLLSPSPRCR